jgi:hypothetical protein
VLEASHKSNQLKRLNVALEMAPQTLALFWHERVHREPAIVWLRGVIVQSRSSSSTTAA